MKCDLRERINSIGRKPEKEIVPASHTAGTSFFSLSYDITNPFRTVEMPKRLGDTDIWKKQRWFRKLIPDHKLAFLYIKDQCDHAGIWNIDCTDLMEDLGIETFDLDQFVSDCNTEYDKTTGKPTLKERIRLLDKGYIWVVGFFQFQYKGKEGLVNPSAKPVTTAIQLLVGRGVWDEALSKGYITLTEPFETPKDKDKDKDKEQDTLKVKPAQNGEKNGKFSGDSATQREYLLLNRVAEGVRKLEQSGGENP
jgi:hypothetical protein